jgi:hypothetical protein
MLTPSEISPDVLAPAVPDDLACPADDPNGRPNGDAFASRRIKALSLMRAPS